MNVQLKYSFKKEFAHFIRGFKLLGIALAIFGFALFCPVMFKTAGDILEQMNDATTPEFGTEFGMAMISTDEAPIAEADPDADSEDLGLGDMAAIYGSATSVFSISLVNLATYSTLVIMLIMMKPAGGEQKKRAMIVPLCCGLEYKNYLTPKFVIYPLSVFAMSFLGGLMTGGLCSSMFANDNIPAGTLALASLMIAVYIAFVITVYLAVGLCSSRPGVMVGVVFLGQMILPSLFAGMGLTDYQPFALLNLVSALSSPEHSNILSDNTANILVSMGISIVIGILLYFVTLAVLNSKRIDNQDDQQSNRPEF